MEARTMSTYPQGIRSSVKNHNGSGALLLTPRLDAQTSFANLFADIGTQEDVRCADLAVLLAGPPTACSRHCQACPGPPLRLAGCTLACGWSECTYCHCSVWLLLVLHQRPHMPSHDLPPACEDRSLPSLSAQHAACATACLADLRD